MDVRKLDNAMSASPRLAGTPATLEDILQFHIVRTRTLDHRKVKELKPCTMGTIAKSFSQQLCALKSAKLHSTANSRRNYFQLWTVCWRKAEKHKINMNQIQFIHELAFSCIDLNKNFCIFYFISIKLYFSKKKSKKIEFMRFYR